MEEPTPLPKHVSWFAPWRWFAQWKPWKRWTLLVMVMLVGYIESPVVLEIADSRFPFPRSTYPAFQAVAAPLIMCMEASPTIRQFYEVQISAADDALTALGL